MRIQTAVISTKELQDALRLYCSDKAGIPDTVIINSYDKEIVVSLAVTMAAEHCRSGALMDLGINTD